MDLKFCHLVLQAFSYQFFHGLSSPKIFHFPMLRLDVENLPENAIDVDVSLTDFHLLLIPFYLEYFVSNSIDVQQAFS
jgi:hypothetical protein